MKMQMNYMCWWLLLGVFVAACDKADENYKKYIPNGETVYPAKVDSLKANPGKNRIQLYWLLKSDSRITKTKVFWNNKQDSLELSVTSKNPIDTFRTLLTNLAEGPYIFQVYTYNPENARSVKSEVNGEVYGEAYESFLINRTLRSITANAGTVTLKWDQADPRSPGVLLNFKDQNGLAQEVLVPSTEGTTILNTVPQTGSMSFRTLILPVSNAIDTLKAPELNVDF
ncbi:protein of unknown function [bacterium A37T11]|nr:protein of unknown function [bacterium A37T11]